MDGCIFNGISNSDAFRCREYKFTIACLPCVCRFTCSFRLANAHRVASVPSLSSRTAPPQEPLMDRLLDAPEQSNAAIGGVSTSVDAGTPSGHRGTSGPTSPVNPRLVHLATCAPARSHTSLAQACARQSRHREATQDSAGEVLE